MPYSLGFSLLAFALSGALYAGLGQVLVWPHYYFTWVIAISSVTFAFYGLDKGLSEARRAKVRVPELVLNLLAVAGGTPGAWLGRVAFRHKANLRKHWVMFVILVTSSLLHVYVLHTLYSSSVEW
jgi:uncharacterized membrane protein YsdA (DUF1294 family)